MYTYSIYIPGTSVLNLPRGPKRFKTTGRFLSQFNKTSAYTRARAMPEPNSLSQSSYSRMINVSYLKRKFQFNE